MTLPPPPRGPHAAPPPAAWPTKPEPPPAPDGARQETLAGALARAAQQLQAQQPPAALREAVLSRAVPPLPALPRNNATPGTRRRPGRRAWAWSGGLAVAAMLLVASTVLLIAPPPADPVPRGGDFVPLVAREDWPDEASAAWIVPGELPQERLAALGLPYDPARAAEPVRAELLVAPSGLVLALRLID